MRSRTVAAIIVVACSTLAACVPKAYIHPNPASVNQTADMAQCEYELEMGQRGVYVPWWYNNSQATGYLLGAAIGQAIRNDRLRSLCMMAKGYRVVPLDGTAPAPIGESQPNLIGVTPPDQHSSAYAAIPPPVPPVPATPPAPIGSAPLISPGISAESKYMFTAEGVAKVSGCNSPVAAMTSKGAGMEMFAIACPNGTTLAIRCEVDGCRILR